MQASTRSMIGLQAPGGLVFGQVMKVSPRLLIIHLESALQVGTSVPWRMELSGHPHTVMGRLLVRRVERPVDRAVYSVHAEITDMAGGDRHIFRRWLRERGEGGTTRVYDSDISHLSTPVHPEPQSHRSAVTSASSNLEARVGALDRIDRRRERVRRALGKEDVSDAFGLQSEVRSSVRETRSARQALRSALRQGLNRPPGRTRLGDTASEAPQRAPLAPAPVDQGRPAMRSEPGAEAAAQGRDPQVALRPGTPPTLEITYRRRLNFRREFQRHLKGNGLFVARDDLGERGSSVALVLRLPSQREVRCTGEVVANLTQGTGLSLNLDRSQRQCLASEAGLAV